MATKKAANNHKHTAARHHTEAKPPAEKKVRTPDDDQEDRLQALVDEVKEAFSRNQFSIPGDIDLQIRGMANLTPHRSLPPEQRVGPGVAVG